MATLPAPLTDDDVVEEFLLRLPPEDSMTLVHAALVCRRWHRIIAGRGFRRRFCDHHHRRPPMLGLFSQVYGGPTEGNQLSFTPTSALGPCITWLTGHRHVVDARHGRVLVACRGSVMDDLAATFCLAVWDPIMGDLQELPRLTVQQQQHGGLNFSWNAAVLCASGGPSAAAAAGCDHLDCQRGPFHVLFVASLARQEVHAYVYSSQAGAWSHKISTSHDRVEIITGSVVAGNTVYFRLLENIRILKCDLGVQEISWIDLPPNCCSTPNPANGWCRILLMTTESACGLGVAIVDNLKLHLWSWEAGPNGLFEWTLTGVIDLKTVVHANPYSFYVVDILHSIGIIIIKANDGVFCVDIESNRATKLCDEDNSTSYYVP